MNRKFLSVVLSICLVLSLFPIAASAAEESADTSLQVGMFPDIEDHWAKGAVTRAVADGYVKGYPDGKFQPERDVTRAEFVSMVNNALQLRSENKVKLPFSDVKESDWFSEEVAKAGYVRYIKGTGDTTFSPNDSITRQEAALMLSRFLPKDDMTAATALDCFPDCGSIADWAKEGVAVVVNKGYLKGHTNGLLAPMGTLTRAEAVTVIDGVLQHETIVREDVSVRRSGDILRNKIYVGDITIEKEVGEGDATLQNLSALSVVYVKGGGSHTVTVENTLIIRLVVTKEGTQVRVLAADGTTIYTSVLFNNNLLVDESGVSATPGSESFEDIIVVQGTVTQEQALQIFSAIERQIESGGQITPGGLAQSIIATVPGSETKKDEAGKIIVQMPAVPKPNEGGGKTPAKAISVTITGTKDWVGGELTAAASPADANVTYQWYRSGSETGTYEAIEDEEGAVYEIQPGDIGCFLKATARGTGGYAGVQGSKTIGPVGFAGGSGGASDPYLIADWYHLNNMRYRLDACFKLTGDLDDDSTGYSDVVYDIESGQGSWEPVGYYSDLDLKVMSFTLNETLSAETDTMFRGTFDGNGKSIRNLRVVREGPEVTQLQYDFEACGLFGALYEAEVKNLTLTDAYVYGRDYTGLLAGYSIGSTISGIVTDQSIVLESFEPMMLLYGAYGTAYVGGIVGYNEEGTVEDCRNELSVSGNGLVGGIVGFSYSGIIQDCDNEGDISGEDYVGGIAGVSYTEEYEPDAQSFELQQLYSGAIISGCSNKGDINCKDYAGGIAGYSNYVIENCYNLGTVYGENYLGGIVGYICEAAIKFNYNVGLVRSFYEYDGEPGEFEIARRGYSKGEIYGYDVGDEDENYAYSYFIANFYPRTSEIEGLFGLPIGIYEVTLEEMRNPCTYVDWEASDSDEPVEWDFTDVWALNLQDNNGLPFLRRQWDLEYAPICLEVMMPTAAKVLPGDMLSQAVLSGGRVSISGIDIPGTFEYWNEFHDPSAEVDLYGMNAYVLFIPDEPDDYWSFAGIVRVEVECMEGEPDDNMVDSIILEVGSTIQNRWIYPEGDQDWFRFKAEAGHLYRIATTNLYPRGEENEWLDTVIVLFDVYSNLISENDDYFGMDSCILWRCQESGTYFIEVNEFGDDGIGRYDLVLREESTAPGLLNGGFEAGGLDNWFMQASGSYPQIQSEVVRSGDYAVCLGDSAEGMYRPGLIGDSYTSAGIALPVFLDKEQGLPVLSFWYNIESSGAGDNWMDAWLQHEGGRQYISYQSDATNGWNQISYVIDVPESEEYVELVIQLHVLNDQNRNHYYIDDVELEYVTEEDMMEGEPDDAYETAGELLLDQPISRWIYPYDDVDVWEIDLEADKFYEIRTSNLLTGWADSSAYMTTLVQYGTFEEYLGESSSYVNNCEINLNESIIVFKALMTGAYYVIVSPDHPNWSEGDLGRYTLRVSPRPDPGD